MRAIAEGGENLPAVRMVGLLLPPIVTNVRPVTRVDRDAFWSIVKAVAPAIETVPPLDARVIARELSTVTGVGHVAEQGPGISTVSPETVERIALLTSFSLQEAAWITAASLTAEEKSRAINSVACSP
ncbi:MAG: hypothetical protein WBD46_03955 [Acidobacteriaceae bacterium]